MFLKKIEAKKKAIVTSMIQDFLKQFDVFKDYLKHPASLKKSISDFDQGKEPYKEKSGDDSYARDHYKDWEDNVLDSIPKIMFGEKTHDSYVREYRESKDEDIESSEALTAMVELRDLIKKLQLLHRENLLKEIPHLTYRLRSLNNLLYGNDEVESWFYARSIEGFSSFLHFLVYALKNYY